MDRDQKGNSDSGLATNTGKKEKHNIQGYKKIIFLLDHWLL